MRVRSALTAILVVLAGCASDETPAEIGAGSASLEREVRGFTMEETHEGSRLWRLRAEYAWRLPEDTRVQLKDIRLVFFDKEGNQNSVLTALEGSVDEETEDLTAVGRVRVVSVDGDTLDTDELNYDKKAERISGPGYVRLAKPDRVLTGTGFEANPDLTDYEVKRDVRIFLPDRGRSPGR